jgi:hypothetical protein
MPKHGTVASEWAVILKNEGYGLRRPHSLWMRGKIIFRFAEISDQATSLEPRWKGGLPVIIQIKLNPGMEPGEVGGGDSEKGGSSERSLSQLIHILYPDTSLVDIQELIIYYVYTFLLHPHIIYTQQQP